MRKNVILQLAAITTTSIISSIITIISTITIIITTITITITTTTITITTAAFTDTGFDKDIKDARDDSSALRFGALDYIVRQTNE